MNSKIAVLVAVCFIATGSFAMAMDKVDKVDSGKCDMCDMAMDEADSCPMLMASDHKTSDAKDSQADVWVCSMKDYEGPNTKDGKCPKCGMKLVKKAVSKGEKLVCPVTGEKANKKYSLEYKGKTYYFCCDDCIGKFKSNSEKYLKGEKKEEKKEEKHQHSH
ncbi:MAG: YHS domain-containing protein [Candidatus Firestonebacteria bacterium]